VSHYLYEFELLENRRMLSGSPGDDLPPWIEVQESSTVIAGHDGHVETSLGRFEWNLSSPDQYSVNIDWGDGTESAGKVVANSDGSFTIVGTHDYAADKLFLISSYLQAADGAYGATATFAATYADPLDIVDSYDLAYGDAWYGRPGDLMHTDVVYNTWELGLFYDVDHPTSDGTSYTVTIDWGDGSASTTAEFVPDGGGLHNVPAPYHFYPKNGDYPVHFTVSRGDVMLSSTSTARVRWNFEFPLIDEPEGASVNMDTTESEAPSSPVETASPPLPSQPSVTDEVLDTKDNAAEGLVAGILD